MNKSKTKLIFSFQKDSIYFGSLLLAIGFLSYGLFANQLGFYWDDWPNILIALKGENSIYYDLFAPDRPLNSLIYQLTFPFLGFKPIYWQIFAIFLRWASGIALWRLVLEISPTRKLEAAGIALLLIIYPSFEQQNISLVYSQHFITLTIFLISLLLMVKSVRQKTGNRYLSIVSFVLMGIHLFTVEYFLSLELLRPLIIYLVILGERNLLAERISKTVKLWIPYLLGLIGFIFWRFYFLAFSGDQNTLRIFNSLRDNPIITSLELFQNIVQGFFHIVLTNWYSTFYVGLINFFDLSSLASLAIGVLAASLAAKYLIPLAKMENENSNKNNILWEKVAILIGAFGVILGILPALLTGREIIGGQFSDRFTLPAVLGASILWIGIGKIALKNHRYQVLFIAILVGLATGSQFREANNKRWVTENENRMFWQLYWRSGEIIPNTPIIGSLSLVGDLSGVSASSALNLLFSSSLENGRVDYWYFGTSDQFKNNIDELYLGSVLQGELKGDYRYLSFEGQSTDSIVVFYPSNTQCVWILTELDRSNEFVSPTFRSLARLSSLERMTLQENTSGQINNHIFGPEPSHGWCYFYQKIAAAQQLKDWELVLEIWEEASNMDFHSNHPAEMIPIIQAQLNLKKIEDAVIMSINEYKRDHAMASLLCKIWEPTILEYELNQKNDSILIELFEIVKCN